MSRKYAVPLNRFNWQAGGKELYDAFHKHMGISVGRYKPWEKRTAREQDKWVAMLKDAVKVAVDVQIAKAQEAELRAPSIGGIAPSSGDNRTAKNASRD